MISFTIVRFSFSMFDFIPPPRGVARKNLKKVIKYAQQKKIPPPPVVLFRLRFCTPIKVKNCILS